MIFRGNIIKNNRQIVWISKGFCFEIYFFKKKNAANLILMVTYFEKVNYYQCNCLSI